MFPASESLKTIKDIRAERNPKMQLFELASLLGFLLTRIDQAFDPRSEEEIANKRSTTLGMWIRAYKRIFGRNRVSYEDVLWAVRVRNMHAHPEKYDDDATKEDTLRAVEYLMRTIELDVIPQVAKTQPRLAQEALGYDPHRTWKWIAASFIAAAVLLYLVLLVKQTSPPTKVEYVDIGSTPEEIRLSEEQAAEASRARAIGKREAFIDAGERLKQNIQKFETKLADLLTNEDGKRVASLDYTIGAFQAIQARARPTPDEVDIVLERLPPASLYDPGGEPLYRPSSEALAELTAVDQGLVQIEQRLRPAQVELSRLLRAVSKREPAALDLQTAIDEYRARAQQEDADYEQKLVGNTLDKDAVWKGSCYGDGTERECMWIVHRRDGDNIVFKSPTTNTTLQGVINGRRIGLTERGTSGLIATYRGQVMNQILDGLWEPASGKTRGGNFSLRYTPLDPSEVDPDVLKKATKPPHPFLPGTKWLLTIDVRGQKKPLQTTVTVDEKTGPNTFYASDGNGLSYMASLNIGRKTVGLSTQDPRGYRHSLSGSYTDTEVKGTASLGSGIGPVKHEFVLKLEEAE